MVWKKNELEYRAFIKPLIVFSLNNAVLFAKRNKSGLKTNQTGKNLQLYFQELELSQHFSVLCAWATSKENS